MGQSAESKVQQLCITSIWGTAKHYGKALSFTHTQHTCREMHMPRQGNEVCECRRNTQEEIGREGKDEAHLLNVTTPRKLTKVISSSSCSALPTGRESMGNGGLACGAERVTGRRGMG